MPYGIKPLSHQKNAKPERLQNSNKNFPFAS